VRAATGQPGVWARSNRAAPSSGLRAAGGPLQGSSHDRESAPADSRSALTGMGRAGFEPATSGSRVHPRRLRRTAAD
jgi:hypothetical protein